MPHIFRFHEGRNNNIYDWKASDKIMPADVRKVMDKTNIFSSSAGTSIPTPLGRMFLFKTAFDIIAAQIRDNQVNAKSIYAAIVSETLDLLELLYKSGSDVNKFRFENWIFDNQEQDDSLILKFFGDQQGHKLLAESFKQAASQTPFNNSIKITLIYYKENDKEVLLGGTSPFTFVFTSPNFKRKLQGKGFKPINGLISNNILFNQDYKQLQERDRSFIKYIESLVNSKNYTESFSGFNDYVVNTKTRYSNEFNGASPDLENIQIDDVPLSASRIPLMQLSRKYYKNETNRHSDFRIELPDDSSYKGDLTPLFLLNKMAEEGQYTSPTGHWSSKTRVSENEYPEYTLEGIMNRELPGVEGFTYPFLSSFDFFERCLIKLPGYNLNNERFVTLTENQGYIFPIKPLFFNFFPVNKLKDYLSIETSKKDDKQTISFIIKIPVSGPTRGKRTLICSKTYDQDSMIDYSGILGIFPLTRTTDRDLLHINKYTIASFEKTNEPLLLDDIKFLKRNGMDVVDTHPVLRSNYGKINIKTTYYQLGESFDIVRLYFTKDHSRCGGIIIPLFKEITNGTEEYIYAIDFGTSNTHVEYGRVINNRIPVTNSFSIDEASMQMALLNKPKEVSTNDGTEKYRDYDSITSLGSVIDAARQVTLREFVPFQIGSQKTASVKFPFKTATFESDNFVKDQNNNQLFLDANIGFYIDEDLISSLAPTLRYETDLKWLLEHNTTNQFNINRISIFFRELLLMIRTKILLEEKNLRGNIHKLQLVMSLPLSMGSALKMQLKELLDKARKEVLTDNALPLKEVTESIAPYYELKYRNTKIQNDSFCNIDIGGGTTDIVLVNRNPANNNELYCYCSSFKFAGKVLWSSGAQEFALSDNGFVAYYKNFIQRVDNKVYEEELKDALNENSEINQPRKTEDVVGLLFSKPKYRFTDIFSDCKELKAVLVIHYSAMVYYITRVCQLNKIELPRTVSFSGKGSEYLSIIFPADNWLRIFTKTLLDIFAGSNVTKDHFMIERSKEPKVITAKGSARFATEKVNLDDGGWGTVEQSDDMKKLIIKGVTYQGFKNPELENEVLTYSRLQTDSSLSDDIMLSIKDFFHLLFDNKELTSQLNKNLEFKDFVAYKSFFIKEGDGNDFNRQGVLRDSFKSIVDNFDRRENVTDSPFFFALDYALVEFSKEIATKYLTKK